MKSNHFILLVLFTNALFSQDLRIDLVRRSASPSQTAHFLSSGPPQKFSSVVLFYPNMIRTWLMNNGLVFADSLVSYREGLFWPGSTQKSLLFSSGLWVAGRDEKGLIRTSTSFYYSQFQPGRILQPYNDTTLVTSNPYDTSFAILTLNDTTPSSDPRYKKWVQTASLTGAPLTEGGTPELLGNSNAYWVMNDLDTANSRIHPSVPTIPLGVEVKNYVFAFNDPGVLSNTIYLMMEITNRSIHTYDSLFVGWFSDEDIGNANDDYAGCDTLLSLAYAYNGVDSDYVYGKGVPACGFLILQSPSSRSGLAMTAFMKDTGIPPWEFPATYEVDLTQQIWNVLQGKLRKGSPLVVPNSQNHIITYVDPGDPVSGTGWIASMDLHPVDVRLLQGSGPVTLAPNGSTRFVLAFIVAQDPTRLTSITALKWAVAVVKEKWRTIVGITGDDVERMIPSEYELSNAYPNPFNPTTTIEYLIPKEAHVNLQVFDLLGRRVATLVNESKAVGRYRVDFDASTLASGVYLYRLQASNFLQVKKMILMK